MPLKGVLKIPAHQLGCILGFMRFQAHHGQLPYTVLYFVILELEQCSVTEPGSVGAQHLLPLSNTGLIAPAGKSPAGLGLSLGGRCGRCKMISDA